MMYRWMSAVLLLVVPGFAVAQQSFPVSELSVDGIYASKVGDPNGFCLLGGNTCLVPGLDNPWTHDALIDSWLAAHPKAVVTRISSHVMLSGGNRPPERRVFVWIEDGGESLNVELVRQGRYVAALMVDMVEADRRQEEMNNDPRLAEFRAQFEKERAETPEDNRPHRLVSDADYAEKMSRISRAESEAKQGKKGMWCDAGMKGRSLPKDEYLVKQYQEHREWFERIRALIHDDPRLAVIHREPKTWTFARSAGVPQKTIDEYVDLLKKLDANEQLVNVVGTGKICLVVADIIYGLFDNGVIKGYVYSQSEPGPLVDDLENWPSDIEYAATAYRVVADHWYLFEVHH
jgi:hypothetical protein